MKTEKEGLAIELAGLKEKLANQEQKWEAERQSYLTELSLIRAERDQLVLQKESLRKEVEESARALAGVGGLKENLKRIIAILQGKQSKSGS